MSNPMTGGFETVVEIATRQINGILGTLHQNGAIERAVLKLLHSASLRIGDPPRKRPELFDFRDWAVEQLHKGPPRNLRQLGASMAATAPPGAAKMLTDAIAGFDRDLSVELPPDVVRGLAKVQVSTLTMGITAGSASEISINAHLRAHYYPDPSTTPLPAPILGELRAAFDISRTSNGGRLSITPSADDAKIRFFPAPGSTMDAVEASRISAEIRKVMRLGLQTPIDLPTDFAFTDFKGLQSGGNQVIALPMQLSRQPAPAGGTQGLTQSFVGSNGFAIAVSEEYVTSLINIEAIRASMAQHTASFTLSRWGVSVSVHYAFSFGEGPTLTFKNGYIEISGRVDAVSDRWWAPNGFVSFIQKVRLTLDPVQQTVSLVRMGDPSGDESVFIPHATAMALVRTEMDKALADNADGIRSIFNSSKDKLVRALLRFDLAPTVRFANIEITSDGVIVRGDIGSGQRLPPVVKVRETHGGAAFTAFESWIPAGRIDRFEWSWVEYGTLASILSGTLRKLPVVDEFILPKPAGIASVDRICLRIEGNQLAPNGQSSSIAAGTTCHVLEPDFALDLPSWWAPLTLPLWRPDLPETAVLREGIDGHIGVHAGAEKRPPSANNTLVYFADWTAAHPLDALGAALGKLGNAAPAVIVVVPAGSFDRTRREFESRLPREGLHAAAQFTEDDEGAWTRTFAVQKAPAAFLVNAKRETVWSQAGDVDAAALAEIIKKHPAPKQRAEFRPLRLAVSAGDAMRDATFDDDRMQGYSLHRFRGRQVILNFWQSWSAPCLKELARLQRLQDAARDGPFIVAFHGGSDGKALNDIRKRLGLSFSLVQDAQHRFARLYGVRCWPTTITIDGDGQVQHIQLGVEHDHDKPPVHQRT